MFDTHASQDTAIDQFQPDNPTIDELDEHKKETIIEYSNSIKKDIDRFLPTSIESSTACILTQSDEVIIDVLITYHTQVIGRYQLQPYFKDNTNETARKTETVAHNLVAQAITELMSHNNQNNQSPPAM